MRLVKIEGMDLRRFEFDLDLTWHVFLLNADETVYGRFGGRDASGPDARITLKGLRHALERALEAHKEPPEARPLPGPVVRAEGYHAARAHRGCIHCHNVKEFRRADEKAAGKWDRSSLWVYPLPENIGVRLDIDAGDRVRAVTPGSPAAVAGIAPGDRITRLNGYPVASFADASFALHKAPASGEIPVTWVRGAAARTANLKVVDGWRKTNLTWRPSMLDLLPSVPFSGDDLSAGEKKGLGLAARRAAFRQDGPVHRTLKAAGVEPGDVVIGFDGAAIEGVFGDLLGHVRRNYLVGDTVTVNVLRGGKRLDLKLLLK